MTNRHPPPTIYTAVTNTDYSSQGRCACAGGSSTNTEYISLAAVFLEAPVAVFVL